MAFKNIQVSLADGIGEIVFDRPPLNVLNIEMMTEINQALQDLAKEPTLKLVVFKGVGKAFSAGVDVGEHTQDKVNEMIETFHEIFRNLYEIPVPTVAAVNGSALGGGCEVATFCDLVLASDRAKFGQPEIKVGVFAPIALIMFPRLMAHKKAFELIMTGDVITAEDAQQLGLVNQVFTADEFEAKTKEYIDKLSALSGAVLKITKKTLNRSMGLSYPEALKNVEDLYLNELMKTSDANEGLRAFLEKRPPVWKDE